MIKAYCIFLIMGFVQIWVMVSTVGGWIGSITLAVIISLVGAYIPVPWFLVAHWYFEGTLPWVYMAAWIVGWGALVVGRRRLETRESSDRGRLTSEQDTSSVHEAFREGEDAYYQDDYTSAIEKLQPLAERGNTKAQYRIGMMYASGLGVERDDAEALKWFQLALDKLQTLSEKGDADAQFRLGSMYYNGWALQQDRAEATTWYHRAAEGGDVVSQYNLGVMYFDGKDVQQDRPEAARWFRKAAEKGNADAQQFLGGMYYNGWGLDRDHAEGANWYRSAAEQGHADAQSILGLMYEAGTGVKKDCVQAYNWCSKAAAQGHEGASENRDRIGRINTILSTGDGTEEHPFVVTSTTEEYLILRHFGKTLSMQMLIDGDKGPIDVMSCIDGSTYHFEISEFYGKFGE